MKKIIVILSTVLFVSVMATGISAQSFNAPVFQADQPRYECGYFYQDGLRVTDCYDENGNFLPDMNHSDEAVTYDDSAAIYEGYEGYAEDDEMRMSDPAMMGDFSDDYDEMPVYGDPNGIHFLTKIVHFSRIGRYESDVVVPEIKGMANPELQANLNDYIKSVAYDIIDQFENDARAVLAEFPEEEESPYFSVTYDFSVATDTDSYLTLALNYFTVAGSSFNSTAFFNFNKDTRELILMDDYFIPGSEASNLLRDEILRQMREQMAEDPEMVYWIDGNELDPEYALDWDLILSTAGDNNQYKIDENGDFVIVFDKYDVAPGYMGNPEFIIPIDVVAAMDATIRH